VFSSYLRGAVNLVFAVLLAAILSFVLAFFIPMMGPEDSLLRGTFEALDSWMLFLMVGAVLASILARALVEGNVGGARR